MKTKMFRRKNFVLIGLVLFLFCLSLVGVWAVDGLISQESTYGISAELGDKQETSAELGDKQETSAELGDKQETSAELGDKQETSAELGDIQETPEVDFSTFDTNNNGTCDYLEANIDTFISRYGSDISYDSDNHYLVVKLNKGNAASAVKKNADLVQFKVTEIKIVDMDHNTTNVLNGAAVGQYIVSTNKELTFDKPLLIKNRNTDSYVSYSIKIEPDGFNDELITKNCGSFSSFYIFLNYEYGGNAIIQNDAVINYSYPSSTGSAFNCNNYKNWDPKSFDYNYCHDLEMATKSKNFYSFDKNKNVYSKVSSTAKNFSCDAFNVLNDSVSSNISNNQDYQYINKSYLAGEITDTKKVGTYIYNYGGQDSKGKGANRVTSDVKCTVRCKEAVSVEYGVPIATTAGLCFEYNVKVTSRIKCNSDSPNPPTQKTTYCTPVPGCVHKNGRIGMAAGPDEDFDNCVARCDGGIYSDSCVDQCYQEVYENDPLAVSSAMSISGNYSIAGTKLAQYSNNTMDRDKKCDGKGSYIYNSKGILTWSPPQCYGRYYKFHPNAVGYHSCTKTNSEGGGISSDCGCNAICSWSGCSKNDYLNPGEAQRDAANNKIVYDKAVNQCNSFSSCNTTTATFSMEVTLNNYDTNGKDVVVHLPFDNNSGNINDEIKLDNNSKTVGCTNNTASKGANTTIISTDGCYSCNKNLSQIKEQNLFQTEWGFSGTWINNKSGEISYVKQDNTWTQYSHKFCTPLDIQETNADWWLYYYKKKYGDDSSFAFNDEEYLEKAYCRTGSDSVTITYPVIPEKQSDISVDYNIVAKARSFGFFEWNIDVSCFYAYANLDGDCNDSQKQRIRSVDLNNLFPNADGTPLTAPTESGRSPGFNWGYHATNLDKDKNYTSSPSEYMRFVQSKGYDIYSDDYLDYEIILTRENIRELKDAKRNYTNFLGDYNVDSVVNYKSPLFRGSNPMFTDSNGSKIPNEIALACNNMENHASTKCQDLSK